MTQQPSDELLGYLQLCADRRFHRKTMHAFEEATSLPGSESYWIEAAAGGAPGFQDSTVTARYAYDNGARVMGWGAHGDVCGGFPERSNQEMKAALEMVARQRMEDFPEAEHWLFFGHGGAVETIRLD